MSYIITIYTNAVTPTQLFFNTKKLALEAMSEEVKDLKDSYPIKSGYKKMGSIKGGRVSFEHLYYGVDSVVKLEVND